HVHLIILTRVDPPLNLSALRVKDQVIHIQSEELHFNYDESAEFLRRNINTDLDEDTINDLYQKTEGWIAGLQLAALSLRNRKGPVALPFNEENRFIINYLMEQIYSQLSDSLRGFLLRTAILNRFTGELTEVVTGCKGSSEFLDVLRRENLFLIPLDQRGNWYRYHNLFSYFLKKRLAVELPDEIQALHYRAAQWYRAQGLLHESFDHAVLSGNQEIINELAEAYVEELWDAGEHALLLRRLSQIPERIMAENVKLRLYLALLKMDAGEVDAELVKIVFSESDHDYSDKERGMLETIRAAYGNLTQKAEIIEKHATSAIKLFKTTSPMWQSNAICILGRTYFLSGNLLEAEKYFKIAYEEAQEKGMKVIAFQAAFHLADTLRTQGRFGEAKALCHEQIRQIENHEGQPVQYLGNFYSILGEIACEENHLHRALMNGVKGVMMAEQRNNNLQLCITYKKLLNTYYTLKDVEKVKTILSKLRYLQQHSFLPSWLKSPLRVAQAFLYMMEDREEEAINQLQPPEILKAKDLTVTNEDIRELLFLARLYLRLRKPEQAAPILEKLKDFLAKNHRWNAYLNCLVNRAICSHQFGNEFEAEAILNEALILGKQKGYCRTFLDADYLLYPILSKMSFKKNIYDYAVAILEAMEIELSFSACSPKTVQLIDPLSPRELEILKLLPSRLSYPEIAEKLYISYSTVRTHVKNIYMKLNAHTRLEAVNIARARRLLQ
ncbi:MAG: hypothetical protein GX044_02825, partial [Firmicutes bacterium]|nr:hypothetical protein [Bacillota bacterium]